MRDGKPLDQEVHAWIGQVLPIEGLLGEPGLEEVLEGDVSYLVCVEEIHADDVAELSEDVGKVSLGEGEFH